MDPARRSDSPAGDASGLVLIGGSAGGIPVLKSILSRLPTDIRAPILVVIHLAPTVQSNLPSVLATATRLRVKAPFNGELLEPGTVYVGVPDRHMVLVDGRIGLTNGPRENRVRPSIDVLFRTAAGSKEYFPLIGVVLSGALSDGAVGLSEISRAGGVTIVQDPAEAAAAGMPNAAIQAGHVDYIIPTDVIAGTIMDVLTGTETPQRQRIPHRMAHQPYGVTCPECWGVLHQEDVEGVPWFRCRVGHAFSIDSLLEAQAHGIENSIWMAVRALEEQADLSQRMAARAQSNGNDAAAERFARLAHDAALRAELVRRLLEPDVATGDPVEPAHE
jgi:two-component system chemotaxis response regulator CheB